MFGVPAVLKSGLPLRQEEEAAAKRVEAEAANLGGVETLFRDMMRVRARLFHRFFLWGFAIGDF